MKILYVSDLHLEFGDHPVPVKDWADADVCILAGDIITANYLQLHRTDNPSIKFQNKLIKLFQQLERYKHVIWVAGNHEFYNGHWIGTVPTMRAFADKHAKNVQVFENDCLNIDDIRFIGCTFWTNMNNRNPMDMMVAHGAMNDYYCVFKGSDPKYTQVTPEDTVYAHEFSREYIDLVLPNNPDRKVVMVTHHPATLQALNRKHSGNSLDPAFATNLDQWIIERPQIKAWISGHTHQPMDIMIGDCRCVSNPRGYKHESLYAEFKPNKVIEV